MPRSKPEVDIGLVLRRLIGKMFEGGNPMALSRRFSRQVLVILSVALVGAASLYARQRPAFRSTIDLVMLNVTVTGPGGRYVADLSADDFQILEDGRQQDVAYFSPANVPLSVSLVLDTSSSMDDEMVLSKQAAMDFIARLRPGDVAEIVSFDSRVEVLQPMTSNRTLLEAAIQRMRAGGSTALYNAVYIVLRQLDKVKPQTGDDVRRQVIVVLSDGEDTASLVTLDDLLDSAKRSQTVIYTVGLGLEALTRSFPMENLAFDNSPRKQAGACFCRKVRWISSMSTR